ncbi:MAG: hypothetical protein HRT89_14095 [Lentisphaeria bacterium]|nr:hypothetical protein [Lentisphaeria bacterium]NQZ69187.1 hypothetical protein [Lentisphaeria bacterium]
MKYMLYFLLLNATLSAANSVEIVENCLRDLKSKDASVRHRSILVLSKYKSEPAAIAGLLISLDDANAKNRLQALVPLVGPAVNLKRDALIKFLNMIGDENVSIRRLVSSNAPRKYSFFRLIYGFNSKIPVDTLGKLSSAFNDKDDIVRQNMYKNLRTYSELVTKKMIISGLSDINHQVRINALIAAANTLGYALFCPNVKGLLNDKEKRIRLRLVKILSQNNFNGREELLKVLEKDNDFEISTEALIGLVREGFHSRWPALLKRLKNPQLKSEQGITIIKEIPTIKEKGKARLIILDLFKHPRSAFRVQALYLYFWKYRSMKDKGLLQSMLKDASKNVRSCVADILVRENIKLDDIKEISKSKYADVRIFAIRATGRHPAEKLKEILSDFVLDDSVNVRKEAMVQLAKRKVPSWEGILEDSLYDDEKEIQILAEYLLLLYKPKNLQKIIIAYIKDGENKQLKQRLKRFLNQKSVPQL